ncbi:hypothetical protein ERJ75_001456900 [Trypanosoma vivax]|uniref:Phosphoribulokinase/uridine kinase domain-containing protein n=1 Tax=Trypanosoma vivax (strain Y486) TaxID=1055687 RepID=F9WTL6_TRYVY|nr:hypothetical protein TRVL_04201 [Trypanosoma vivax]KAH8607066.1 hypothetical protein ERJ75_001456900 [Trypanosoma vivax]CCD20909.1 hypothetical protein, conserved [Trypanosoma vivax Y486]|eukprot:CCD20909.1 hypothetical protein, conserved [Trypanosoma vivax Y486]
MTHEGTDTRVVIIGITGCSASGKSTIASRLAEMLCSPLLPISMDAFFDKNAYEQFGTWEDPRCIRNADYVRCVSDIRHCIRNFGACVAPLQKVKEASQFIRSSSSLTNPPRPRGAAVAASLSDNVVAESCKSVAANLDQHNRAVADDEVETVYIVCEGFLLFATPAVCELCDYFIFVDTDYETACLRRFLRKPRRSATHIQAHYYSDKIERMHAARRKSSQHVATDTPLIDPMLPRSFVFVLPKLEYSPPLPSKHGDYEGFWLEEEFRQCPPPTPHDASQNDVSRGPYEDARSACSWMKVKDLSYIRQTLQRHQCVTGEESALFTQRNYFEFRYWFYYEVLGYFHQLKHLFEENIASVCLKKLRGVTASSTASCSFRLKNDSGVSTDGLNKQLESLLLHITA